MVGYLMGALYVDPILGGVRVDVDGIWSGTLMI